MQLAFNGVVYEVLATYGPITVADSFVVQENKLGTGNGEAKLYVGQTDSSELRSFFGTRGFEAPCFLLRNDLLKYLDVTKAEYIKPEQPYRSRVYMPTIWKERQEIVSNLPELIPFQVAEQTQIDGPRVYVNSPDRAYRLIRELSLPNITFVSAVKLRDVEGRIRFYFRLFADFFGESVHPSKLQVDQASGEASDLSPEVQAELSRARNGQGEYRRRLLEECPCCPITLISDDRILIASHIKPWVESNAAEKVDPKNGFILTPTFDKLFDRGFMSFSDDRRMILSPFLSNMVYSKLGIADGKLVTHLPVDGRLAYLDYHRREILKR